MGFTAFASGSDLFAITLTRTACSQERPIWNLEIVRFHQWLRPMLAIYSQVRTGLTNACDLALSEIGTTEPIRCPLSQGTLLLMCRGDLSQCDRCLGTLVRAQYQPLLVREITEFEIEQPPVIGCHLR